MQVFYTSPWVPAEWIEAHGLEPRGIWFAEEFSCEPLRLTAGACAFAEAVMTWAERHPGSAMIFTTHCDQLRRAFDEAASVVRGRLFLFNLPATWQTPVAGRIFAAELERLGRFLIELGGHAPSRDGLDRVIRDYQCARSLLLDAATRLAARGFAEAVARFYGARLSSGAAAGTGQEASMPAEPQPASTGAAAGLAALPDTHNGVPLALLGGPLPRSQWHLLDLIQTAGGRVVLNATEPGERNLWPASAPVVTPGTSGAGGAQVQSLSRNYLDHCVDVFQRPNTRLYDWLGERLAARRARGIVLWHYVGCDLWRAEAQPLREAFGLPVLPLDADEAAAGSSRNAGRIQAFVESLQ